MTSDHTVRVSSKWKRFLWNVSPPIPNPEGGSSAVPSEPKPTSSERHDRAKLDLATFSKVENVIIEQFSATQNVFQGERKKTDNETSGTGDFVHKPFANGHSPNMTTSGSHERSAYEVYSQYMFLQRRGVPLWEPRPEKTLPLEYRRNGVDLGDVGIVDSISGRFNFLFNLFLPAGHEINEGRVPDGFIHLDKSKVKGTILNDDILQCFFASSSVRETGLSDFAFQTTGREGAVLVVKDGGLSKDLRNYSMVEEYVIAHANAWWEHFRGDTEFGIDIVVGMDKVPSWGMATFQNVETPLGFKLVVKEESQIWPSCVWKGIHSSKAGPGEMDRHLTGSDMSPPSNQCVFIRTLNFSVTSKNREPLSSKVACPNCSKELVDDSSQDPMMKVNVTSWKDGLPISHPTKLLNQYLLKHCPNAKVVITRDTDWMSVITETDVMPGPEDILTRVLRSHKICQNEGVVTLEKINTTTKSNPTTITHQDVLPTNENEVVCYCTPDKQGVTTLSGDDDDGKDADLCDVSVSNSDFILQGAVAGSSATVNKERATTGKSISPLTHVDEKRSIEKLSFAGTWQWITKQPTMKADSLNICGDAFLKAFRSTGSGDDIDQAIVAYSQAIACVPPGDPRLGGFQCDSGVGYLERYTRFGDSGDLRTAIDLIKRGIEGVDGQPLSGFVNLGSAFFLQFQRTGNLEDLSEAICYQECAVQSDDVVRHSDFPAWLNNLANSLSQRFECCGNMDDIHAAIRYQKQAVELTSEKDSDLPTWLNNLGNSLSLLFKYCGNLYDISDAIQTQERAVQLTPDADANLPGRLTNLGFSYLCLFERTGHLDDISQTIKIQQRAVQLTPDDCPDLPDMLTNLASSLIRRFEHIGDLGDVYDAIKLQKCAIKGTPAGHIDFSSRYSNLGSSFLRLFERSGDVGDLNQAIDSQNLAIQSTYENINLPLLLTNLGTSYLRWFEYSGDLDHISSAIQYHSRAVSLLPDGHAALPTVLLNLGISYLRRFEQTGDLGDISKAIEYERRGVLLTPGGRAELPLLLSNLGVSLFRLFEFNGNLNDIDEAIEQHQHALRLIPEQHSHLPVCLGNLGISFSRRFEVSDDPDDIYEAIKAQQRALEITPDGHACLPRTLYDLGNSFSRYFEHNREPVFLEKAISNLRNSATSAIGSPSVRLLAATRWAELSQHLSSQHLNAHECIIQLLSIFSGIERPVQRRHEILTNFSHLSIAASAAALSLDRPDKALEWLVEGRYIVWNHIYQLRTSVDRLRAHNPILAGRFSSVSQQLEIAGSCTVSSPIDNLETLSLEEQTQKHIQLAKEWAQLLVTIRSIHGFENFLRPKTCADIMLGLPKDGVVVVINVHNDRCDALALTAGAREPQHIPLPTFSYQEADRLSKGLHKYLLHHGLKSRVGEPFHVAESVPQIDLAEVLSVLWSQLVSRILESLGFLVPNVGAEIPRMWWCPTGPLTSLPIHAAGIYTQSEGVRTECLADFAISSYIPTVNNLDPNIVEQQSEGEGLNGLLIVGQTPGAANEVKRITKHLENHQIAYLALNDESATVEKVLEAMDSFPSIHLACRASQDTTIPIKSSIYLHDGPLQLLKITDKNFTKSNFTFLSACQTRTGGKDLPEEMVHIAAGMLAAGYKSVVGTLWPIYDQHGPDMVDFFYQSFFEMGHRRVDGAGAARALHQATQRFRMENNGSPLLAWVPYIHIGV